MPLAHRRQPAAIPSAVHLHPVVLLVATTQVAMTGTTIATLAMMILLPSTALRVVHPVITALPLIHLGVPAHLTILAPLTVALGATS